MTRFPRPLALPAALSALVLAAASLPASAGTPAPVSGPSPFAACKIRGEKGKNYLNAVVEPWVDVHPTDSTRLVAAWQQDRWSNGGSRGIVSAYSTDGGANWTRVVVPGINKCSGGTGDFAYNRASDPWTAISPNGNAYVMSLTFTDPVGNKPGVNAMLVNRSTDGGATWGNPTVLRRDTDPTIFNDKNAITADPADSRYVYAVWDQLKGGVDADGGKGAGGAAGVAGAPDGYPDGVVIARERLRAKMAAKAKGLARAADSTFFGPTFFTRTIDSGQTWETARIIYDPGANAQTIANQAVVLNNGDVLVFFTDIPETGPVKIRYVKSTDHGASFGAPVDAAAINGSLTGTITPDRKKSVRDGSILFDVAYDRNSGRLYLTWQDTGGGGVERVAFAMSSNSGASWSPPVIVNKTPPSPDKYRTQAFVPSIAVDGNSRVVITYYDFRNDPPRSRSKELADYWAISCMPSEADCRSAGSWGNETRLTSTSFNMLNAPYANGLFVGDYQGLVSQPASLRAVFGIATKLNKTSIVTSVVP